MRREAVPPRPDWQKRVEKYGLHFHTLDGEPYWDETACYVFSRYEIDQIEKATYALFDMCLKAVEHVIENRMFGLFLVPPEFEALVVRSWEEDHPTIYGRFDLAYDGKTPPKMLEFNADTPTGLQEAAVAQWFWLKDTDERGDQFNSIHEKLIDAWKLIRKADARPIHFAALSGVVEDFITVEYLRDTAIQAGLQTHYMDVEAIGWDRAKKTFTDDRNRPIERIFKLYPWEWLLRDDYGPNILAGSTVWMEPAWKMILSCKSLLPLLYQLFPDSPYLLPAWFEEPAGGDYVRKPVHGREGANIRVVRGGQVELETDGPYAGGPYAYQQLYPMTEFEGRYPVFGSWVINGWSCGLGIREDGSMVTRNTSRFLPHRMSD